MRIKNVHLLSYSYTFDEQFQICVSRHILGMFYKNVNIFIFCNKKRSNLVSYTTALSEILILCVFSFNLQSLIFQFLTYFVFCKKAVKHREMGQYFVAMGAAIFRLRESFFTTPYQTLARLLLRRIRYFCTVSSHLICRMYLRKSKLLSSGCHFVLCH